MQGDIVKIIDTNKTVVAMYGYDDWGKLTTAESSLTAVGQLNPIRYCGYYYDPETGRFVNADDPALTLVSPTATFDKNLYAYCDNNPVMRADNGGAFWNVQQVQL